MVARPSPRSLLEHGSDYDVASALSNRGRHALIEELSVKANIIDKQLEHGISILQALEAANRRVTEGRDIDGEVIEEHTPQLR